MRNIPLLVIFIQCIQKYTRVFVTIFDKKKILNKIFDQKLKFSRNKNLKTNDLLVYIMLLKIHHYSQRFVIEIGN